MCCYREIKHDLGVKAQQLAGKMFGDMSNAQVNIKLTGKMFGGMSNAQVNIKFVC